MSALLHRHGALACWDYAAAAPYVAIDMGSAERPDHLDAIFLSPHKFIGGPEGLPHSRGTLTRDSSAKAKSRRSHG